MAITHTTAVRNGIADYVVDQLDGGTIELATSGDVEVATLTFGTPAFGAAASGVATANSITSESSATGGTTTKFFAKNSGATTILTGSVTATSGGGDIELSSTTIGATDTVSLASLTYEATS